MKYQKKTYNLGGQHFASQKDLIVCIKYLLKESPKYVDLEQDTQNFLLDLIQLHPAREQKIGCGIRSFQIHKDHFQIMRLDGGSTDFSYLKCLGREMTKLRLFKDAARQAIQYQIDEFKSQYSREELFGKHVDHKFPFNNIVEDFIKKEKIDVELVEILGFDDNETDKRFADEELKRRFAIYHKEVATLQLLDWLENLKKGSKIL